jgi:hypothetical protein
MRVCPNIWKTGWIVCNQEKILDSGLGA